MAEESIFWLRNEASPPQLRPFEFIGPANQTVWMDPCSTSKVVHKGKSVEELTCKGYVGIYILLKDIGRISLD